MEEITFPRPAVAEVLENHFVEARLHTDGKDNLDQILELQQRWTQSVATPSYVVVRPADEKVLGILIGAKSSEFLDFLQGSLDVQVSRAPAE